MVRFVSFAMKPAFSLMPAIRFAVLGRSMCQSCTTRTLITASRGGSDRGILHPPISSTRGALPDDPGHDSNCGPQPPPLILYLLTQLSTLSVSSPSYYGALLRLEQRQRTLCRPAPHRQQLTAHKKMLEQRSIKIKKIGERLVGKQLEQMASQTGC